MCEYSAATLALAAAAMARRLVRCADDMVSPEHVLTRRLACAAAGALALDRPSADCVKHIWHHAFALLHAVMERARASLKDGAWLVCRAEHVVECARAQRHTTARPFDAIAVAALYVAIAFHVDRAYWRTFWKYSGLGHHRCPRRKPAVPPASCSVRVPPAVAAPPARRGTTPAMLVLDMLAMIDWRVDALVQSRGTRGARLCGG